jgi:hypothetical protein
MGPSMGDGMLKLVLVVTGAALIAGFGAGVEL